MNHELNFLVNFYNYLLLTHFLGNGGSGLLQSSSANSHKRQSRWTLRPPLLFFV